MKATLQFDLENLEDIENYEICRNAALICSTIRIFKKKFKNIIEYKVCSDEERKILEELYESMIEIFEPIDHLL